MVILNKDKLRRTSRVSSTFFLALLRVSVCFLSFYFSFVERSALFRNLDVSDFIYREIEKNDQSLKNFLKEGYLFSTQQIQQSSKITFHTAA